MNKNEIKVNGVTYVKKGTDTTAYNYPKTKKGKTWCVVRTYSAGVWAGWFDMNQKGKECIVEDAIRIWYWDGANSLSDVATQPCTKPENCKFCQPVKKVLLKEVIESIPATQNAKDFIVGLPSWKK